jgi:hypothetical protein
MAYGGALIDGPEHPWYGRTTTEVGHSTAYGCYQFLGSSYKEAAEALGLGNDTSPVSQDLCAVWTIDVKRRATAAILAGELERAVELLKNEWVSLPGLTRDRIRHTFLGYGGTLTPQNGAGATISPPPISTPPDAATSAPRPDLPPQQPETAMPLLAALLPMVLQLFAPRAQAQLAKVTGAAPDVANQFITDLFGKLTQVTGQADPVQAVAAIQKAPPAQIQEVESHALDYLDKIAPFVEKLRDISKEEWAAGEDSMDRAATRAMGQAYDPARMLTHFSVGAVGSLTMFLCAWITILFLHDKAVATEVWAALTGLIGWLTAKLGGIYDNRFGTTRQSAAKDVVIQQLSQSRR